MRAKKAIENRFNSRRQFLQGIAAGMALPPLMSLWPKGVQAASTGAVRRIGLLSATFGMRWEDFFEIGPFKSYLTEFDGAPNLRYARLSSLPAGRAGLSYFVDGSFADLYDDMNVYYGLAKTAKNGHQFGVFSGGWGGRSPRVGRSIDYIIEDFAPSKRPTIRTHGKMFYSRRKDGRGNYVLGGEGVIHPNVFMSDGHFFRQFFTTPGVEEPRSEGGPTRRKLLVDQVLADYKALRNSSRIGSEDKNTLDAHVSALEEVERKIVVPAGEVTSCSTFPFDASEPTPPKSLSNRQQFYENMATITVQAFACDASRVLALHHDGGSPTHHNMDGVVSEQFGAKHQRDFLRTMATHLVRRLKDTDDPFNPGTSLLDNSFILFANEHGDRGGHRAAGIPMVSFGGLGGHVRSGYLMSFVQDLDRSFIKNKTYPVKMLLVSLLEGMGVSRDDYMKEGEGGNFGTPVTSGNIRRVLFRDLDYVERNHNNPLPFFTS